MLAHLEALVALADTGTMTRAATRLRITQSAVSKRIAALADELGFDVIERDGRRVVLTPAGRRLLERAAPLLAELRHALAGEQIGSTGRVSIGVSDSVLASWGAAALADASAEVGLELAIGAHRSPVAIDRVRAGEYALALVAGPGRLEAQLSSVAIADEEMVIVPSRLETFRPRRGSTVEVLTIEPGSSTWRAIAPGLAALKRARGIHVRVERTVQSLACAVQMARAGFGHALAPRPLALAMGIPASALVSLPRPGVTRPIALVGRRAVLARPLIAAFTRSVAASSHPSRGPS